MRGPENSSCPEELPVEQQTRHQEFPSDPQQRLAALLASFNNTNKATILNLLPPLESGYISPAELNKKYKELVKGTGMANVAKNVPPAYCQATLCPIGLVAEEITLDFHGTEVVIGFSLTEAGQKYGIPAACLALDFEARHQFSLFPVLGPTQSPSPTKKRSPSLRASILHSLSQEQAPVRVIDLATEFHIKPDLLPRNLVALKKCGAIQYESVHLKTGETQVIYHLPGKLSLIETESTGSDITFTKKVAQICQQLAGQETPITQKNVSRVLAGASSRRISRRISSILSLLASRGYLVRGVFKGGEIQSIIQILPLGETIVREFINPLIELSNDDWSAEEIDSLVKKVRRDLPEYACQSASLYYPYSLSSKKRQTRENVAKLVQIVSESNGITSFQLSQKIGLTPATISRHLKSSVKEGKIRRKEKNRVDYYFPI